MSDDPVQPLRINKGMPAFSPAKPGRPLAEVGLGERRRNSPSFNQATKGLLDSSPFDASPSLSKSPRAFWQNRDPTSPGVNDVENSFLGGETSPSPRRRASIEKLQKASRVKNSSMFAREANNEYDPLKSPQIERPLAAGRSFNAQMTQNQVAAAPQPTGINLHKPAASPFRGHRSTKSINNIPFQSPTKENDNPFQHTTSPPPRSSPTKSSMANGARVTDMSMTEYDISSTSLSGGRQSVNSIARAVRHAKSVTFDQAPPEVNEYEQATPEPSSIASTRESSYDSTLSYEEGDTFEGNSMLDRDDSFDASLEDTEKTPVVLPEDWRHMSPEVANDQLADKSDDVFSEGLAARNMQRNSLNVLQTAADLRRSNSAASDMSDARPLPPLPGAQMANTRLLPILPQHDEQSLEDRFGNFSFDDGNFGAQFSEQLSSTTAASTASHAPKSPAPRISRESILRKVKSRNFEAELASSPPPEDLPTTGDDYIDISNLDPDVPIPSREASSNFDEAVPDVVIKQEDDESEVDHYAIPEMYSEIDLDDHAREGSVVRRTETQASGKEQHIPDDVEQKYDSGNASSDDDSPTLTRKDLESAQLLRDAEPLGNHQDEDYLNMPHIASFLQSEEMSFTNERSTPTPPPQQAPVFQQPSEHVQANREYLERMITPEEQPSPVESTQSGPEIMEEERPASASSVIHYQTPAVPEKQSSIKTGGRLKARPSATPADLALMAETRRQVSGEKPPPIPERSERRSSQGFSKLDEDEDRTDFFPEGESQFEGQSGLLLDFGEEDGMGLGLDKEFDRVIEAQKKGYLMRQNTKVVVASSRQFSDEKKAELMAKIAEQGAKDARNGTRSAGNSPRKGSHTKAWETQPWNGKVRRKSIRTGSGLKAMPPAGAVPPMPGQESALASVDENAEASNELVEEDELAAGRGLLFVKVVGVKDLDLPLPKNEKMFFELTLDNGLHCVTTAKLELGHNAPIGQEFELVVLNDLEFQLTLQTKLEKPTPRPMSASSANSQTKTSKPSKTSAFSRFLTSPKKRKEAERKAAEEAATAQRLAHRRQQSSVASTSSFNLGDKATSWDLLHTLVADDGSFARAYVAASNYEKACYGRPITVDVPAFNEWALETDETIANSVRSKQRSGVAGPVRKPPYKVGKMTLQLLFVPRPKGASDEEMPKSLNGCIREMREADDVSGRSWEGYLSQQGGDCPFWRRRFFKLTSTKLTAYHEYTNQPRATINLAKAAKLIDDRSQLVQPNVESTHSSSNGTSHKKRRKSGFAEDEEGYMYVENGFRLRFANGEVIDFYADTPQGKEGWMKALAGVVGKSGPEETKSVQKWTQLVLAREATLKKSKPRASLAGPPPSLSSNGNGTMGAKSAPTSPVKNGSGSSSARRGSKPPPVPAKQNSTASNSSAASNTGVSPRKPAPGSANTSPVKQRPQSYHPRLSEQQRAQREKVRSWIP